MTVEIDLPYNFSPRFYQQPVFDAIDEGFKRIILCHHRRAGKDLLTLNLTIREMFARIGYYLYVFPDASLGRRVIWNGATKEGKRFLDYFPKEMIKNKNNKDMLIELTNSSIFQIVGSDRFTNVGINPVYVTFSEHSLQNPLCWDLIRPVLAENDGIAVFQGTPRGRNHFYDLFMMAERNPKWFTQRLGIEETKAVTLEAIEDERQSGMSEELIQQEFYVSFSRGVEGSYYGREMEKARLDGRISNVPYDSQTKVNCSFDLGMDDCTSIWWWQQVGQEIRFIDYYEANGEAISHYVKILKEKPYIYGDFWLPHDAKVRELGTGISRLDVFRNLGITGLIVPDVGLMDGIEVCRGVIPRCWFDENRCVEGIKALEMYHKEYNPKKDVYSSRPVHDRFSHGSDSFRYASIAINRGSLSDGELSADGWAKIRRKHMV